jgi:hypothetical protein
MPRRGHLTWLGVCLVVACGCSSSSKPAARPNGIANSSKATSFPTIPGQCPSTARFDYIERTTSPGFPALATVIGNVNVNDCKSALAEFRSNAPNAEGDCTTIALASDNPGYEQKYIFVVYQPPPPPLNKVIESAGPGC